MDSVSSSAGRVFAVGGGIPVVALVMLSACEAERGLQGSPGPGAETPTELGRGEDAPSVIVTIADVGGASGPAGIFRVGDRISARFTLTKEDGSAWALGEMTSGRILVSGPSFNYQRVLPMRDDVISASLDLGNGAYVYTFVDAIPAAYAPPYNDSPSFDEDDGELTGQVLLDGTYTLGLSLAWDYTVEGMSFQQVGEATVDFLLGDGAGTLAPRAVSGQDNCNACHVELRSHEGRYRSLALCLLCHTAGAEDLNDPAIEGGTPDMTIDAGVFFHKLHNGSYLPSVLGVATNPDGSRDYAAPARPYRIAGEDGTVHDFSNTGWPVMPNRILPLPRDVGYLALGPAEQALEDRMRSGVASCFVCHGDPDGAGPLTKPVHGDVAFTQPSRKACGSCHDDVDWDLPYVAQFQEMPPQPDETLCTICHDTIFGGALAATNGHVHPLEMPAFNPGLNFDLIDVQEGGTNDGDGTIDPGERIRVSFTVSDDAGLAVDASSLASVRALVSGPTTNLQTLLAVEIPTGLLTGPQPYTGNLPQTLQLEFVGDATASFPDVFSTSLTPHLVGPEVSSSVLVRTATSGGASALAVSASRHQNFIDVADGAGFQRDDFVVIDDGVAGLEEYLRLQFVDGTRLWFSSPSTPAYPPGLRSDHPAGAMVLEVQLTPKVEGVDFALDKATGSITEMTEFGAGNAALVSYTTDFEFPAEYPSSLNASPDLGEATGKWTGKDVVDGTYLVGISGYRDPVFFAMGELTTYRASSPPATREFLVGSASVFEPYDFISSGQNCNACHQDVMFHQGRDRGFDSCILCHGSPGAEDLPRYVAANAPATDGVTVEFRAMLHKIHRGQELTFPFSVVGAGPDPYPMNFRVNTYENFVFPAQPGRTTRCARCHGEANARSLYPEDRDHPTQQLETVPEWRAVCGTCHDSDAATGHIELYTSPSGLEACAICHGTGESEDVTLVHESR